MYKDLILYTYVVLIMVIDSTASSGNFYHNNFLFTVQSENLGCGHCIVCF